MLPVFASSTRQSILYILSVHRILKTIRVYVKGYVGLNLYEHSTNNNSMIASTIAISIIHRFSYCATLIWKAIITRVCIRIREFKYCVRWLSRFHPEDNDRCCLNMPNSTWEAERTKLMTAWNIWPDTSKHFGSVRYSSLYNKYLCSYTQHTPVFCKRHIIVDLAAARSIVILKIVDSKNIQPVKKSSSMI